MKVLFDQTTTELEISGTRIEWEAFSLTLRQDGTMIPCNQVENSSPYSDSLECMIDNYQPSCKVEIQVLDAAKLKISGEPNLLQKLALNARNLGKDAKIGSHLHSDYQGDEFLVSEKSAPAVFFLTAEGA